MPEKQESVLDMTDTAALIHLSEETRRVMGVLSAAKSLVCYIFDAGFHEFEERHEADAE